MTCTIAVKKYEAMIGECGFSGVLNREIDKEWRRYFPGKFSGDLTGLNHISFFRCE